MSHPSRASTPLTGGGCGAPSRRLRPPGGWTFLQLPRWGPGPTHPHHQEPQGQEQVGGVGLPDLLLAHDRGPARGRRGLDRGHLGDREPSPRRSETWSRARTLPAAHPQQPRNHGHLKESGHQPHPPLPGHQSLYRNHHQIPIKTTHTSHQTTDPTNPLNQIRRPPAPRGLSNTLDPRRRNLRLHPRPRPHQLPRRTRTQKDPTVAQVPRHHRRILHTGYRRPLETFPVAITAVL